MPPAFLVTLHLSMFYVLVTAGTICTFWGLGLLIARWRAGKATSAGQERASEQQTPGRLPISPIYRSAIRITGLLALIQAILGGILYLLHGKPADNLHYVYGLLVLLAIPAASVYLTGKPEKAQRDLIVLIVAALILAAAAVRAFMTG